MLPNNLFQEIPSLSGDTVAKLAFCVLIVAVIWLIRQLLLKIVMGHTEDIRSRYLWQKNSNYIAFIIGIALIAAIWSQAADNIATFIALVSAGIAIALRDVLANAAGWLFIIWFRPLVVGDRIQIGAHSGDVVDISLFHINLMEIGNWVNSDQSTGRIINIPNSLIFTETLANYSKGFQYIWNEIPVLLTFESDWKKAKALLNDIAVNNSEHLSKDAERHILEASSRYLIFYSKLTPIVYTSVEDSGVLLTIRYLCEPRKRRGSVETIWENILTSFAEHDDIDFAYPTRRFFNNQDEGKAGMQDS